METETTEARQLSPEEIAIAQKAAEAQKAREEAITVMQRVLTDLLAGKLEYLILATGDKTGAIGTHVTVFDSRMLIQATGHIARIHGRLALAD